VYNLDKNVAIISGNRSIFTDENIGFLLFISIILMNNIAIISGIGQYLLINLYILYTGIYQYLLMNNVAIMPRNWSIFIDEKYSHCQK
jgi:DNA phosphorothioation-dependent restriction protein DptG